MRTPQPVPRPKVAQWLFDRDLSYREGGELFGCSHEHLRKVCLPFGDPDRRVPTKPLMERIMGASQGELQPGDFYEVVRTKAVAS